MTVPASPTNNWGAFFTSNIPVNPSDGTTPPAPGAAANVAATVPSPPTFNAADGETSTEYFVTQLINAAHDGQSFQNCPNVTPGSAPYGAVVGNKEDVQTTPSAPSGNYVQQGASLVTAAQVQASYITSGIDARTIQVYKYA
jgi:hypothetical protein